MYSFQTKAESLPQLGQKLMEAAKLFLAEKTDDRQESFNFDQTNLKDTEEVSNHSVGAIREEVAAGKPKSSRKPRAKKGEAPLTSSPEVSAVQSTAAETPVDKIELPLVTMRDTLTSRLNAFLEHEQGGIQPARDLLASFGAAKMSEIPDHRLEEVIVAINNVIGR